MLRHLLLAASAALNLALVVLLVRPPHGVRADASATHPEPPPAAPAPAPTPPPRVTPPPPGLSSTAPSSVRSRAEVLAGFEDVDRVLNLMRAQGLSPDMCYRAGSMIVLKRLRAERRRTLLGETRYTWQYGATGGNLSREKMAASAAHSAANAIKRDDIMLALMGDDYLVGRFPDSMVSDPRFGGLPPEKVRQVLLIETDYSAAKLLTMGQGSMDSARAIETRIAGDKDANIRAVLTPEEYERYQAAASPATHMLKRGLMGADVTDAQFAAISRRARAADPLWTGSSNETLAPFTEIILTEAGPQAALAYARNMDRSQPSALAVLESTGLDPAEVARRYVLIQTYRTTPKDETQAAADYQAVTAGLSPEQLTALERTNAGSRLRRAANIRRRTP